jgi:hypothetical protein
MRLSRPFVWTIFSILLIISLVAATQVGAVCSDIVETALEATDEICQEAGRNQACYGHIRVAAQPQPGIELFQFDTVGDRVNVAEINSLRLSPMDVDSGSWGVALMRLQADIPDEMPDENVTLLLFGDVQVRNVVEELVLRDAEIAAIGNVNVRLEPANSAFVMQTLAPGTALTARGRTEDSDWVNVVLPDDGGAGWIRSTLIDVEGDLSDLKVTESRLEGYGPMQAFYLQTGNEVSTCAEAPNDGILIQTPEGVAEVRLWINEVKIRLGSTAFIQARPGNEMVINTVEGRAIVEALGQEQVAPAGTSITIPLNENSAPSAPPSEARPYNEQAIHNLPVSNLEREITPAPAAEETEEPTAAATPTDEPTRVPPTDAPTETPTDVPPTPEPQDPPTPTPFQITLTPETGK